MQLKHARDATPAHVRPLLHRLSSDGIFNATIAIFRVAPYADGDGHFARREGIRGVVVQNLTKQTNVGGWDYFRGGDRGAATFGGGGQFIDLEHFEDRSVSQNGLDFEVAPAFLQLYAVSWVL